MLARLDPRFLDRLWFPLGDADEGGNARGGRARRPRRRPPRREPGGVLPRGRRLPDVPRAPRPLAPSRARSSTRTAASSERTTASGASRRDSGAVSASRRPSRSTRCGRDADTNTVVVGPRAALATTNGQRARPAVRRRSPRRGEASLPLAPLPATVEPREGGFVLELDEPAYGVAPGQAAVLYETAQWSAPGLVS